MKDQLPIIHFSAQPDWEVWLAAHHETSSGLWLKVAKKSSGIPTVTYQQALDVALCYGWIDGQKQSFDTDYFLQRFTRRGKRSMWSLINCRKVEELIAQGKMKPAGLAEIEAAKIDGRWAMAYPSQSTIKVPDDLQQLLDSNPIAAEAFGRLPRSARYSILFQLHHAKKPETRSRRMEKFLKMLLEGNPA